MRVVILGMGRLGRTLARLLPRAGHEVLTWQRGQAVPLGEIAWITVSDDAIAQVARLVPPGSIVLHSSGALGVEVLRPYRPAGNLHPMATFPGPEVAIPDLEGVPAAVAGDAEAVEAATVLAQALGLRPVRVPGDRPLYHAASVIAGNFAAVLLAEAADLLVAAGVEAGEAAGLLLPLAHASLDHAALPGHGAAITGPFARGDATTVAAHRRALASAAPRVLPAYDALGRLALDRASGLVRERREAVQRALTEETSGTVLPGSSRSRAKGP
ncbi:MAG: DUF2520 domain-containing protein [Deltaproteobacteria bacterium]|nr:DUF2520 domain-containing protein [Deltaproteobacteria bacterium]